MNIDYKINNVNVNSSWSENLVNSKLNALGNLKGKKVAWIQSDLTVKRSNWFTRLIWTVVAKHFSWMRKTFYGVDLKQSRSILVQIGSQIQGNPTIKDLFDQAVGKFNQIAPRYTINPMVAKINADTKTSLKSLGFDNKEKVLTFLREHGKKITSLNLNGIAHIENVDLEKFIECCPNLNHLLINWGNIDDTALYLIAFKLTALQKLNLNGCKQITDAGLWYLKEQTALQELNLGGCSKQITDAGLWYLKGLTALQELNLDECYAITDAGLAHLKGLTGLQTLNLTNCKQITDAGLWYLKGLTALQTLNLTNCEKITDAGLAHLKGLTALQTLNLKNCEQITNAGLEHLKELTALQELNLSCCFPIKDAGLAHLKGLTALEKLDLSGCYKITDAGLEHLKGLTALQKLFLFDCYDITDAGLAHLKGLTPLKKIQ